MNRDRQMRLRRLVAGRRGGVVADRLATLARFYLVGYENLDWDAASNGEHHLLDVVLATRRAPVVIDVGANLGEWTAAVRRRAPGATVHAIEVVPALAADLTSRFDGDERVTVHALGLAERTGTVRVAYDPHRPELSRLVADDDVDGTVDAVTTTGDALLGSIGAPRIDLVKIDAEGFDREVLAGFAATLAARAIDIIQFEYSRAATARGITLGSLYDLLVPAGYLVGKLLPSGVGFGAYSAQRDEDFPGLNYVAVRGDDATLAAALRPSRR
ncbi:MAG: FkbM family methyltransferase [Desertimonas sp.]